MRGFIEHVPADVLVEITTLDPRSGQPAIDHVRQALGRGMHVVTANKGPVAFALRRLDGASPTPEVTSSDTSKPLFALGAPVLLAHGAPGQGRTRAIMATAAARTVRS